MDYIILFLGMFILIIAACTQSDKEPPNPTKGITDINAPGYWSTELKNKDSIAITKHLLIDLSAKSTDPSKPAFMAPPAESKEYYGFPLIKELSIDGFTLGAITDFLEADSEAGCTIGDAFVEAPDGTRAGIFWEVSDELKFCTIVQPDDNRWGVYSITVLNPVKSIEDMKKNFELMLPLIKHIYERTH
jgi:hypothetical protein